MMRVLVVLKSTYLHFQTDSRVKRQIQALVEAGYDVTLLLVDNIAYPPKEAMNFRVINTKLPEFWSSKGSSLIKELGQQLLYYFKTKKIIKSKKPDIIIMNDLNTLFFAKCKVDLKVYDSHELWFDLLEYHNIIKGPIGKGLLKTFELFYTKDVDLNITVNDSIAIILEKRLGRRFHVIRNIPRFTEHKEIDIRKSNDLPSSNFIIVHAGSISENRGLQEIVEVIKRLHRDEMEEISIVFYGIGVEAIDFIKKECPESALERHRFNSSVSQDELYGLLRTADLGLILMKNTNLNNYYSLPNKLFEYLMNGLPVIAPDFPEIKKIILKYDVGWLVDTDNVDDIYSTIQLAFETKEQLRNYRSNTSQLIDDMASGEDHEKLVQLIKKLQIS